MSATSITFQSSHIPLRMWTTNGRPAGLPGLLNHTSAAARLGWVGPGLLGRSTSSVPSPSKSATSTMPVKLVGGPWPPNAGVTIDAIVVPFISQTANVLYVPQVDEGFQSYQRMSD